VDCAGKTGTTQSNYDRWYVGYTPYLIGGVWLGYEYPRALSGSNQCIEIWDDVMQILHRSILEDEREQGIEAKEFQVADGVIEAEYCMDSGKLVTPACLRDPRGDRTERGYFTKGTEPQDYCTCHVPVAYDTVEGGVAFLGECPSEDVAYIGLICVERSFPVQVYVTDAQYVWRELPADVLPETAPSLPFFHNLLCPNEFCGISRVESQYNRFCRTHFNYFEWKERYQNSS
jgi:penicillin-binding protein 1A